MKVLVFDFVTTFGGVQQVMINLFGEMRRLYPEIMICCLDGYAERRTEQGLLAQGLAVDSLPINGPTQLNWNEGGHMRILCRYGWSYLGYLSRLCRYVKRNRYQLIYAQSKKGLMLAATAAKICRIPYVYHAHGFKSSQEIRGLFRVAVRNAAAVIAISKDVKDKLIAAGISEGKIHVIYNGVDTEISQGCKVEATTLRWAVGASMQYAKGIHIAVAAAKELKSQGVDAVLELYGEAVSPESELYLNELRSQVASDNMTDQIRFMGWTQDLKRTFQDQDIVVLPSFNEGLPMVILEAMSQGKTVIASDVGEVPEIIIDGENGLLVKAGSVSELTGALQRLAEDVHLRKRMGENGLRQVADKFSLNRQANELASVFNGVLSVKQPPESGDE